MRKQEAENVCFAVRFYISRKLSNDKKIWI
ncbi:hypothetical protein RSJ8_2474 [Clostridium botulinum]|nr:hypothetical protein NPD1_272 [Clostridium botulinum]APQ70849.1 hypothetical protein RSJ8_2474 [Clostridium botulinum]